MAQQEYRLKPTAGITETQYPFEAFPQQVAPSISEQVVRPERITVLQGCLTKEECCFYIDQMEKLPLLPISKGINYRSNIRCRVKAPGLSQCLWERISPFLKPIQLTEDDYQQTSVGYKLEGVWKPIGIDINWVVSKYPLNSHFGPHFDGPTVTDFTQRTLQSLVIYLNDGFTGGATNFLDEDKQAQDPLGDEYLYGDPSNIQFKVSPSEGSALIFNHHQLHEGEKLLSGEKYIMRSDIIYIRDSLPRGITPKEVVGINFLIKAHQAEVDKNIEEATKYYRLAYHQWPDLQFLENEL